MFDVVIIGGGVVGAMTARALSAYKLKICVLEKENDVAMGASKANSAIVHAGFDAKEGSLKARFNVRGSEMMEETARSLGVSYRRNGSLVIGFSDEDLDHLKSLLERGNKNGVKDLKILTGDEARKLEPDLSPSVTCALYAPTGAIVCPYELTIAAMGHAMDNGALLVRNFEVVNIERTDDGYVITSANGEAVNSRFVVNCAGIYSDKISAMVGDDSFTVSPRTGEYMLLDKTAGNTVNCTVFRTPSAMGKGILVTPTVDGNLLCGPTATNTDDKEDTSTTSEGLATVSKQALDSVPSLPLRQVITSFCGIRSVGSTGDFIIKPAAPRFINCAGIESPGLSASPAIAEYVLELLQNEGLTLEANPDYIKNRPSIHWFREASDEEKAKAISKDGRFAHIICRCECVTEGEIAEALTRNPAAMDIDGVKRRTRSGMGRCQGGFCTPSVIKMISEIGNIPLEKVTKSGKNSFAVIGKSKTCFVESNNDEE